MKKLYLGIKALSAYNQAFQQALKIKTWLKSYYTPESPAGKYVHSHLKECIEGTMRELGNNYNPHVGQIETAFTAWYNDNHSSVKIYKKNGYLTFTGLKMLAQMPPVMRVNLLAERMFELEMPRTIKKVTILQQEAKETNKYILFDQLEMVRLELEKIENILS